ncbi:Outer membrane protein OmpA [Desulfuromusa kysingii]|uniref:Outer membrane protein OmpA n=1 Tax=Desulfuromusa kysingii TaxID=37625 RepID=A0A1H4CII3_9BACT|nr:OmpA family protein [Desulfuromusa kysingii]SEA60164.1 Outer membrane protein OmpA [Desulfuromusa kysingii]
MEKYFKFLFAVAILLMIGLPGCAGPTLNVAPVAISDNPTSKIFELEDTLAEGRKQQIHVLSPTWYAKAADYLEKARYGLANDDSVAGILQNIAYGHAHFDKAKEYALIAQSAISQAIKARDLANAAGAASLGEDYQKVEDEFKTLTADIENNNLSRAEKNESQVAQDFADLELRAIKENTLGEVRNLLATNIHNGAKKLAPKTLQETEKALIDADLFITQQRYEREEMQNKANAALFQAQRLGQIMAASNALKTMSPEDISLRQESQLHQLASELGSRDLRNEPTDLQLQSILESVVSLQEDNQYLKEKRHQEMLEFEAKLTEKQSEIDSQRQQIAALEGQSKEDQRARELIALQEKETKARLESERHFQQLFNEVQGLFAQDQAEVYKQAKNLVIRLKAMQFPVGKDLIMPNNYALLSQVRNAIRTFGNPDVVIEGHTDNTGSAAINALLSQNRAEAVRQYFIANGTLEAEKITALGYGPERPLAANDTPEGRAINRRIDVIIKTEMSNH